jgi:hypothetical protein
VVRQLARVRAELRGIVLDQLQAVADAACDGPRFDAIAARVAARDVDAYSAAAHLLDNSGGNS